MFCRFCGSEIPEGGKFCGVCGKAVEEPEKVESVAVTPQAEKVKTVPPMPELPMKWFKFIIYAQLFLSALSLVFSGFMKITGLEYGADAEYFYYFCPPIKVIDIVYGLLLLAVAALAIVIRQKLAHYKAGAPNIYIAYPAILAAVNFAYIIAQIVALAGVSSIEMDIAVIIGQIWGSILQCGILIPVNYVYFKKRRHLFVN